MKSLHDKIIECTDISHLISSWQKVYSLSIYKYKYKPQDMRKYGDISWYNLCMKKNITAT